MPSADPKPIRLPDPSAMEIRPALLRLLEILAEKVADEACRNQMTQPKCRRPSGEETS
jgi:hypothetical protein